MDLIKRQQEIRQSKAQLEVDATSRWIQRKEFRENPREYLKKNVSEKAKLDRRYDNYNIRESARPIAEIIRAETKIRTPERRIGDTLDLSKRPPSAEAFKFGKPVGRIYQIPDAGSEIEAFGTGFLVAPNVLLTNNHVLPSRGHAEGCAVNFGYEYNEFNKLQTGIKFRLDPSKLFFTNEALDFSIVYVESTDLHGNQLSSLGCIPLIATKGKIVINDPIHIVQYPLGYHKQYSTINNVVKDILEEEGLIQYTTDTLESSSGSPGANKYWEVVVLHHSGIAKTINGVIWSRFDKPWDRLTMTDDDKIYIANEGISVSRIIDSLSKNIFNDPNESLLVKAVLENSQDKILEGLPLLLNQNSNGTSTLLNYKNETPSSMSHNVFNFYNSANINIYTNGKEPSAVTTSSNGKQETHLVTAPEKKLRFDENYSNRRYKGYKAKFLGVSIPFPKIHENRKSEIIKKDGSDEPLILDYYHYSLIMNKAFRLQMCSAVNVDYDPALKSSRDRKEFGEESKSWRPDKRIPIEYQITDEEFYKPATQIDRGHIVRRDDSCYGNTELEIEYANSDTFHWPNCTPQHEGFNQSMQYGLWGMLENAVKDGLSGDDTKASIFAGPVLVADPSRTYNNIYYPVKFWKVIAAIDGDEGLVAHGFILDQSKVIDRRGLEAKFDFSQFKSQQVSLTKIEKEAGIIFPQVLKDADIFVKNGFDLDDEIVLESKSSIKSVLRKQVSVSASEGANAQ